MAANPTEIQNRLSAFSYNYLIRDGNIGNKKIHVWHLADDIQLPSGSFGGYSYKITDRDQDTTVTTEEYAGDNRVRMYTAGTERVILDASGWAQVSGDVSILASGHFRFDGMQSQTYWMYNANSHYLEGWVDGTKRIEL